jgi:hypothetical protein
LKISKQISDRYPFTINADQTEIHFTLNQNTASFDQSKNLVPSEGEYWKIRATEDVSASFFVLHDLSLRLNIGRLDCAKDGSFDWFLGPVEARRASDSEMRAATTKEMESSDGPKPPDGTF